MATAIEEIEVVLDVVDEFSDTFSQFLTELSNVQAVAKSVDDINIDVDVNDRQLDALLAKMGAADSGSAISMGGRGVGGGGRGLPIDPSAMDNLLDKFNDVSKQASDMGDNLRGTNFNMAKLHNLVAQLVPVLVVLIGTLPALITALVALGAAALSAVAALGAIGGFGMMGAAMLRGESMSEGFKEIISQIQTDFIDAFQPLALQLAPIFERGLRGLSSLFDEIASRGNVLVQLQDEASAFGDFMLEYVPDALASMGTMVSAFSEVFGMIGDFLNRVSILGFLTEMFGKMYGELVVLSMVAQQAIPALIKLSIGFLKVFSAISTLFYPFTWLLNNVPYLAQGLAILTGSLLTAATASMLLGNQLLKNAVLGIKSMIMQIPTMVTGLYSYVTSAYTSATATGVLTTAVNGLKWAIRGLLITTGIGALVAGLGIVAEKLTKVASGTERATQALKDFKSEANGLRGSPYSGPSANLQTGDASQLRGRSGGNVTVNVPQGTDEATARQIVRSEVKNMSKE